MKLTPINNMIMETSKMVWFELMKQRRQSDSVKLCSPVSKGKELNKMWAENIKRDRAQLKFYGSK